MDRLCCSVAVRGRRLLQDPVLPNGCPDGGQTGGGGLPGRCAGVPFACRHSSQEPRVALRPVSGPPVRRLSPDIPGLLTSSLSIGRGLVVVRGPLPCPCSVVPLALCCWVAIPVKLSSGQGFPAYTTLWKGSTSKGFYPPPPRKKFITRGSYFRQHAQ